MKIELPTPLQLIGAVALWAIDRWREGATGRAERREQRRTERHLRALRRGEQRDAERDGFKRKGDP